jgi:hypothetical protein
MKPPIEPPFPADPGKDSRSLVALAVELVQWESKHAIIEIDFRATGTDLERIRAEGQELVARAPEAIVASPGQVVLVLRDATTKTEMNGWRAFNHVEDHLAVGNKKSVSPGPGQ